MNALTGVISLDRAAKIVPEGGLSASSLRVELSEKEKNSSWIAELIIQGEIPWCIGETRKVMVRIMSDEFRDYVVSQRPKLKVMRGGEMLGYLIFDNKNKH